jgi:hypothetical protein
MEDKIMVKLQDIVLAGVLAGCGGESKKYEASCDTVCAYLVFECSPKYCKEKGWDPCLENESSFKLCRGICNDQGTPEYKECVLEESQCRSEYYKICNEKLTRGGKVKISITID